LETTPKLFRAASALSLLNFWMVSIWIIATLFRRRSAAF
jgi:hypothetical protein